jgi:hypothetical protein
MRGFGDLEAVIMQRVWDHAQPVTVRDLVDELQREREIAYTTVMTTCTARAGWPGSRTARPTSTPLPPVAPSTAPG